VHAAAAHWHALGTEVDVRTTAPAGLDAAVAAVEAELEAVDRTCSRFRADSELARVNAAGGWSVPVTPRFVEALGVALRAAALTGGLVDPTVGAAMRAIGYDVDFAAVAPDGPPLAVVSRPVPGWRRVELDAEALRLRMSAGVMLDLGATAKALAADRAADAAAAAAGCGVLVSLGGDIAVAGAVPEAGWEVLAGDAAGSAAGLEAVRLRGGGLATSGTTARRWTRGDRALHHIVDPRTGMPAAERWTAVTVVAASCVDANIASTAAIVLGEQAPSWLAQQGLPARLCAASGEVRYVGGWEVVG